MKSKKIYFETTEEVVRKKKGWIELETDYIQLYTNVFNYTKEITDKWAVKYLLWILGKADKSNIIPHGKYTFIEFQNEYKDSELQPSEKVIREAITELVKAKVFIMKGYNNYELNPRLFWQKTAKEREETVLRYDSIGLETELP